SGGRIDHALECTGSGSVATLAVSLVGRNGACILLGGGPPGARFETDHFELLWGRRVVGVLGGGSVSQRIIPALVDLYANGRFPFDRLMRIYEFSEIEEAFTDALSGAVVKPVVRMTPGYDRAEV